MKSEDLRAMRKSISKSDLTPHERLMLLAVRDFAGVDRKAFPSQETLRKFTGLSRSAVQRNITGLVKKGWLSRKQRPKGGVNDYEIFPIGPARRDSNDVEGAPPVGWGGTASGVGEHHQWGTEVNTEVSIEVSNNQTAAGIKPTAISHPEEEISGEEQKLISGDESKLISYSTPKKVIKMRPGTGSRKPPEKGGKVADIAAKHEMKTYTPAEIIAHYEGRKLVGQTMEYFWRDLVKTCHPEVGYVKPLTGKERGQLQNARKALGDEKTCPMLGLVVEEWSSFTLHAKDMYGAFGLPSVPTIRFLAMHLQAVFSFWEKHKVQVQLTAQYKPKPLPAPVKKAPPPPKEVVSLDVVLAAAQENLNGK